MARTSYVLFQQLRAHALSLQYNINIVSIFQSNPTMLYLIYPIITFFFYFFKSIVADRTRPHTDYCGTNVRNIFVDKSDVSYHHLHTNAV